MDTNAVNQVVRIVEDVGIGVLSMKAFPMTVLVCLMAGGLMRIVPFTREWMVMLSMVLCGGPIYFSLSDPAEITNAPFTMHHPQVRVWIIGFVCGFIALGLYLLKLKDWIDARAVRLRRNSNRPPERPPGPPPAAPNDL